MTTILLLTCVVCLWGIILFRLWSGPAEDQASFAEPLTDKQPYFNMVDHQYDTVELDLNYRDPFSSASYTPLMDDVSLKAPLKIVPVGLRQVDWTKISYTGYIDNKTNGIRLAIMSVEGSEVMLKVGQVQMGIKLISFSADSVKVGYQGAAKFIKLK